MRSDVDRDGGVTGQNAARALDAGLVVVIKSIAQGDRAGWHIAIAGIGDGAGYGIDRCAVGRGSEGDGQRAGTVAVGADGRAAISHITAGGTGYADLPGTTALIFNRQNVLRVRTKGTAAAARYGQGGAKESVHPLRNQFDIADGHAGIQNHSRANDAAVSCRVQAFNKGVDRGGVKIVHRGRVIDCRDRDAKACRAARPRVAGANCGADVLQAGQAVPSAIGCPKCQIAGYTVVVAKRHKPDLVVGICQVKHDCCAVTHIGGHRNPCGAIQCVLPGALCRSGLVGHNGQCRLRGGYIAATRHGTLVVSRITVGE